MDEEITCSPGQKCSLTKKICEQEWKFCVTSRNPLACVVLMDVCTTTHFSIKIIYLDSGEDYHRVSVPVDSAKWENKFAEECTGKDVAYTIIIQFRTEVYGTFQQTLEFRFASGRLEAQRIEAQVEPIPLSVELQDVKECILSNKNHWDPSKVHIVKFDPSFQSDGDANLLKKYPLEYALCIDESQITKEGVLSPESYISQMHNFLYLEELAQLREIQKCNLMAHIKMVKGYMLASPASTMKYCIEGELFGFLTLCGEISEDTHAGRLLINSCQSVLFQVLHSSREGKESSATTELHDDHIYEALIEDRARSTLYLRFNKEAVEALHLQDDTLIQAEVQFQLNRLPFCERHQALDNLSQTKFLFPDLSSEIEMKHLLDIEGIEKSPKLNAKQKCAVLAITAELCPEFPPVIMMGPFGTGKTYTMAHAIKLLLTLPETKILICTHSNSAADLYIREYLQPLVAAGNEAARPLRIYYVGRWVGTVHPIVQWYCTLEKVDHATTFRLPTLEEVEKHRIIITTLGTARYLSQIGVKQGHFTHIMIDEAGQALECEAVIPLTLADDKTRVILAGDPLQLCSEVYSPCGEDLKLNRSLLERLCQMYPTSHQCKVLLGENYRSHNAIVQFLSEAFYGSEHVEAKGDQLNHDTLYPLAFFAAFGEDKKDPASTSFYNMAEVCEVVDRVKELLATWPTCWGMQDESSIAVLTPSPQQVIHIRAALRKHHLSSITVESVRNVQGKQFRVVILSTVRTHHTCPITPSEEDNQGFLNSPRLMNTALTRSQSQIIIVGDPLSLSAIGTCRLVWRHMLEVCHENKSLFGISWEELKERVTGLEMKAIYGLNPMASTFIPTALRSWPPMGPTTPPRPGPHSLVDDSFPHVPDFPLMPPYSHFPNAAMASYIAPWISPFGMPVPSYPWGPFPFINFTNPWMPNPAAFQQMVRAFSSMQAQGGSFRFHGGTHWGESPRKEVPDVTPASVASKDVPQKGPSPTEEGRPAATEFQKDSSTKIRFLDKVHFPETKKNQQDRSPTHTEKTSSTVKTNKEEEDATCTNTILQSLTDIMGGSGEPDTSSPLTIIPPLTTASQSKFMQNIFSEASATSQPSLGEFKNLWDDGMLSDTASDAFKAKQDKDKDSYSLWS